MLITFFVLSLVTEPASQPESPDSQREVVDAKRVERLKRSFAQRTLSSHPFVQPQFVASAIPTSHLGLGFGGAGMIVEGSDPETGAARRSTYLAGLGALDGGVRIGKWVGLAAALDGIAGVGGTPDAALDVGAAAGFRWNTRGFVRVLQRESTALSVGPRVFGGAARGLVLQPGYEYILGRIDQLIADGVQLEDLVIDPAELQEVAARSRRRAKSIGGGAQIGLAHAFGRFVGIQAGLEGGGLTQRLHYYDDDQARDVRESLGYLRMGAALSIDAGRIPFAALIEYDADMNFGAGEFDIRHQTGLGLFMNGLTHTLGLQAAAEFSEDQISLAGMLSFRSYF